MQIGFHIGQVSATNQSFAVGISGYYRLQNYAHLLD